MYPPQQNPKSVAYGKTIFEMFNSSEYLQTSVENRKTIIGTAIYKHVEELVGIAHAPKVTGMIIDLEPIELNFSVSNWEALTSKVSSAMKLLIEKGIIKTN